MSTLVRDIAGMTKTCNKCGVEKPLDAFNKDKRRQDGRRAHCRDCTSAVERERRATDSAFVERELERRRAKRRGEKMDPIGSARPADERFDDRLILLPDTGCLVWMGHVNEFGYGHFKDKDTTHLSHRWAYARAFGPVPEGHEVHHECRNTLCCEPSHLRAVTPEEHAAIHAKEVE